MNKDLEKELLPRLRILAYVLLLLAVIFLGWAIFFSPYPKPLDTLIEAEEQEELTVGLSISKDAAEHQLSFYTVALVFLSLGITCLVINKKKSKALD